MRKDLPTGNLLVDILKTTSNRHSKTTSVYKTILAEIETKVRRKLAEGASFLMFEFPLVKPGLPTYDIESCQRYVIKRLHQRGLDTLMTSGTSMQVSWERLLRTARKQRIDSALNEHRRRKEHRAKEKEARKKRSDVPSIGASGSGVPIPPHADEPDDLFSVPSIKSIRDLARSID